MNEVILPCSIKTAFWFIAGLAIGIILTKAYYDKLIDTLHSNYDRLIISYRKWVLDAEKIAPK